MAIIEQGMKVKNIGGPSKRSRGAMGKKDISIILGICIPILLIVGFAIWYFSYENFYIGDYIKVKYSGYNGKGSAEIELKDPPGYDVFLKTVALTDDASQGGLSNGDIINVEFSYDQAFAKENNLRVKDSSCEVVVEGLPDGTVLTEDVVFSALSINFEGISPEIQVSIKNESTEDFFDDIEYEIEGYAEGDCYASGEAVTITAHVPEDKALELNYDINQGGIYKKSYEVPKGASYLRDSSKITDAVIDELDTYAKTLFGEASEYGLRIFSEVNLMPIWVNGKTTFKWQNPRLISAYFTTVSEDKFGALEYHDNDVKLVYEATLMQADGVNCVAEVVVQFTNLLVLEDGSLDLKKDSGRITAASYKNANIVKLVRSEEDDSYTAIKLK